MQKNTGTKNQRGIFARLNVATQIAADAFAAHYGVHVTAALIAPERTKRGGKWVAPKGGATLEGASGAYVAAMCAAYGVEPGEVSMKIVFNDDDSFLYASLSLADDADGGCTGMPRIMVQAWPTSEVRDYIAGGCR